MKVLPLDGFPDWTNSTDAQLIRQLLNPALPLKDRRQAARALARNGSNEGIAALKTALVDGPPYLKAAIGEALGECAHPEAGTMLTDLAGGSDETAARGAIRGLAIRGDANAASLLNDVLFDAEKPASVREEAALALGDVRQPGALSSLLRAAEETVDPAIAASVLAGLGKRPFAETEEFFRNYLESPETSTQLKVTALEALGNAEGEVAPLLLKYAADPNPELRAAAAWALATADTSGDLGPQLVGLLQQESDPQVRVRLYQALENQNSFDVQTVLDLLRRESDAGSRLAGLTLLAGNCRSTPTPELLDFFNRIAVPELRGVALSGDSPAARLAAVMALGRAGTAESTGALEEIAGQSRDPKIVAATQSALKGRKQK